MRLIPQSLFSRIVLVLLAGLVVAQLLSFALHMHERRDLLVHASGMQAAQRIADIVRLLDTLEPAERRRIVQVLSAPPLTVRLDDRALALPEQDADAAARAALFGALLRRTLGDGRQVSVVVTQAPFILGPGGGKPGRMGADAPGHRMGPGAAMLHGAAGPGLAFVAQVRLADGAFVTFDSRQPAQTASWPYRLLASVAVLLAAVIIVSLVAVRWATRPLKVLADAADELGRDIDRPPLPEKGPEEVMRAARAFNTMQARLAGYIRERTRVLAAMSHDLKTPVTRLRLRAELLDDGEAKRKLAQDLEEMEAMIASTLDFLRGLEGGEPVKPVDVMALLESLQADLRETGGAVEIAGSTATPYPGRPQALKRCLSNLVENAVKYGGGARIRIDDSDARLEIRVEDEGPGLPPDDLEKVFEPFYRVEGSRSRETGGTGLGLTIARSIAEAHGGTLVLRNRVEGGLEAVLTLPRSG
jgi:signal transduction histidine kinase